LRKIDEINAEQLALMRVRLPYLTAQDLLREERRLGLGLTLDPDTGPSVALPRA
jgi:hypothetical protein